MLGITLPFVQFCGFWQMHHAMCPPLKCCIDSFRTLKTPGLHLFIPLSPLIQPNSSTKLLAIPDLFNTCRALPFPECHIGESIHFYSGFWDWLLSLSNICLKFLNLYRGSVTHFFLFLNNNLLYGCITVYSLIEGKLD
jgi:hypothetical protein